MSSEHDTAGRQSHDIKAPLQGHHPKPDKYLSLYEILGLQDPSQEGVRTDVVCKSLIRVKDMSSPVSMDPKHLGTEAYTKMLDYPDLYVKEMADCPTGITMVSVLGQVRKLIIPYEEVISFMEDEQYIQVVNPSEPAVSHNPGFPLDMQEGSKDESL